jgi:hypothetical protein
VIDPFTNDAVVFGGFTRAPDWDTPAPRQAASNDLLSAHPRENLLGCQQ